MAISEVKKFLFLGAEEQKRTFFSRAQELGLIHFDNISPKTAARLPENMQAITEAIKILRNFAVLPQVELSDLNRAKEVVQAILDDKQKIEKLEEEIRILHLELSRVEVFGEFDLKDIEEIKQEGNRVIQFYCAKSGQFDLDHLPDNIFFVDSLRGLNYFVGINISETQYEKMTEIVITRSLSKIRQKLEKVKKEETRLRKTLSGYQKYNDFLHHALLLAANDHSLTAALDYTAEFEESSLFASVGWVVVDSIKKVEEMCKSLGIFYEEIALEPTDKVPTYMDNQGVAKVGEDLVQIYDTPSTVDKDPSLWVLFFFSIFFGMIVNDAGYGVIFFLLALYLKWRLPKAKKGFKRLTTLLLCLSIGTTAWGVLSGSYFGIALENDNPLLKLSVMERVVMKKIQYHLAYETAWSKSWLQNQQTSGEVAKLLVEGHEGHLFKMSIAHDLLLEFSMVLGIIHLSCSFLRNLKNNWGGIGWIILMCGGYLYFSSILEAVPLVNIVFNWPPGTGAKEGLQLIYVGFGTAALLSLIQHGLHGLGELAHVLQLFADVLSYLRIYALALAGAVMAETANQVVGAIPFVFAIIVLFIAHSINIMLGVMLGVIHGLRLNFLEWYRYSFIGGGKPFNPLRLKNYEE